MAISQEWQVLLIAGSNQLKSCRFVWCTHHAQNISSLWLGSAPSLYLCI